MYQDTDPMSLNPCAATASMFLYAEGSRVVCCQHDTLDIMTEYTQHARQVRLLAVDNQSKTTGGDLVVSGDDGNTFMVWHSMTGSTIWRHKSHDHLTLTVAAWMRNGNVAFGTTEGNIKILNPSTSEFISSSTLQQAAVTALAPSPDCRTFAIGYQNGSLCIADLRPPSNIRHKLINSTESSLINNLEWHGPTKGESDKLAVQMPDGGVEVWSVAKKHRTGAYPERMRMLDKAGVSEEGLNWMGWSKYGRIIQYTNRQTKLWNVRTKHVTHDVIPTPDVVRGLAVYGPGAKLFTLGPDNAVQQFDLDSLSITRVKTYEIFSVTRAYLDGVPDEWAVSAGATCLVSNNPKRQILKNILERPCEVERLIRHEMERHPERSLSRLLLAKWLHSNDPDIMVTQFKNMDSLDWMAMALSGIGRYDSQTALARTYAKCIKEARDVHVVATMMLGIGHHNEAVEVYVACKCYMEALILTYLSPASDREHQANAIIDRWGKWSAECGQQQLAGQRFASTDRKFNKHSSTQPVRKRDLQAISGNIPVVLTLALPPTGDQCRPHTGVAKTLALEPTVSLPDQTHIAAGITLVGDSSLPTAPSHLSNDITTTLPDRSYRSQSNTPVSSHRTGYLSIIFESDSEDAGTSFVDTEK